VERDLDLLVQFSASFELQSPGAALRLVTEADAKSPMTGLHSEVERLRSILSPVAAKHLGGLLRRGIRPVVAGLRGGVCGKCNMAVPTGVVSAILSSRAIHECLRCKRVLVPNERLEKPRRAVS
jgi:predicted  nucleic acid-binding Zn-ribbon protein